MGDEKTTTVNDPDQTLAAYHVGKPDVRERTVARAGPMRRMAHDAPHARLLA
jgi:hypothetical protein